MTSMSSQCSQSFIKAETIRNCCLIFFASMCHSLPTHPNLCKQLCACFQYVFFFPVRFKQAAMHCQCVYIINMSVRTILHLWGSVEEHLQSLVVGSRVDWSCSGQIYQICQLVSAETRLSHLFSAAWSLHPQGSQKHSPDLHVGESRKANIKSRSVQRALALPTAPTASAWKWKINASPDMITRTWYYLIWFI